MSRKIELYAGKLKRDSLIQDVEKVFSAKFQKSIDESYYLKISETKIVFYYKFDVIVFLDFKKEEIEYYLDLLPVSKRDKSIFQDYSVSFDSKMDGAKDFSITEEVVYIREKSLEYLEVISLLLAHSVALEDYETEIDTLLENTKFYSSEKKHIKEQEVLEL